MFVSDRGAAGALGAVVGYQLARMLGGGYDMTHNWAWIGCAIGVIAFMRRETSHADTHPAYVALRHTVRLALSFIFFMYINMTDQGNSFAVALIVAAIAVTILHFVLRAKMLRFTWNAMLWSAGLRPRRPLTIVGAAACCRPRPVSLRALRSRSESCTSLSRVLGS